MEPVAGECVAPRAEQFLESMRGIGYSLEAAVADLVDNSISANARNVWITFRWAGSASYAVLLDDGLGMAEGGLVEAMRPGTAGPQSIRGDRDLGRFGLGLKTASLSQCRRFTVGTKQAGEAHVSIRSWDLDYVASVGDWILRRDASVQAAEAFKLLTSQTSGTAVVWEGMDRIIGRAPAGERYAEDDFLRRVESVRDHLAMVFHRYLEDAATGIRIYVNGREERNRVRAWNPFLPSRSESTPLERIPCFGVQVLLQGFVLPHRDRLSDREYQEGGGPNGWNAQQGFYVYRNRRLLVSGGWLGLGESRAWTQEEFYKLARISVDFTNALDSEWQIDVKKSTATPPRVLRDRMVQLANEVRRASRRAYAHRGRLQPGQGEDIPRLQVWSVREGESGPKYRVSRLHPLVSELLSTGELGLLFESALRLVESTVPVQRIWLDAAEAGDRARPEQDLPPVSEVLPIALRLVEALQSSSGMTQDSARRAVLASEPFRAYPALAEMLRK